jgi:hypothetical protein
MKGWRAFVDRVRRTTDRRRFSAMNVLHGIIWNALAWRRMSSAMKTIRGIALDVP